MSKKSTGLSAITAFVIGLVGLTMTGCGLDTPGGIMGPDTIDSDPGLENVIPIEQLGIELERLGS